jgi:6-phosphogluconate dehydrogenase
MAKSHSDIGLIGLAVMGQNLALNIADHGFQISVYNRTTEKTDKFVAENPNTPGGVVGAKTLEEFVQSLARPRKAIILVQAGKATDAVIDSLVPLFEQDDIIIDGGNALWTDTIRREKSLREKGLRFIGSGVSGGEEGARFGPSLMPGGDRSAYKEHLEPIWNAIAAKVDAKTGRPLTGAAPGKPIVGGVPCATYIGENGAGHYVKMVHNGIEYGDMQMICEAYDLMKRLLEMKAPEMGAIFSEWNAGMLGSFLIEITADILKQKDPKTKKPFVDVVLDTAGQKGTGKWTSVNALDMGVPAPTIAESVFARCLSAIKEERVAASRILKGPSKKYRGSKKALVAAIHDALYCSKICSYAQGFQLMREAQKEYKWQLDFGQIAQIWRGGCIIRATFLQKITEAYQRKPDLANLLLDSYFNKTVKNAQENWRRVVALASECGVPVPTFSSALSYYDGYRSARLPANLLQGQRDFFGAHTYERVDQPRGKFFHIDWPEPTRPQLAIE